MASKGGLLSRLTAGLSRFFTGKELVGFDFNGNRYYRWRDKNSYGEDVEKRMVSFPAGVKYDPRLVATEWFRWLQKTRHDPPTPEELQQGEEQRQRLKQRVAALDAAEAARRFQAESLGLHAEQAGPAPDMGRFIEQLTGKGYGQPEEAAPGPERPAARTQAPVPPAPAPAAGGEKGGAGNRERSSETSSAGAQYEPETWKPGG